MKPFTVRDGSTLQQFQLAAKEMTDTSKLRAKLKDGNYVLYTSSKGAGTGLKNRLFGTVDARRANVISALLQLSKSTTLSEKERMWLIEKGQFRSDITGSELGILREPIPIRIGNVRTEIEGWDKTNNQHREPLGKFADQVEQITKEINAIADEAKTDSTAPQSTLLVNRITEARAQLTAVVQKAKLAAASHNQWYVEGGPRNGIAPLLKREDIDNGMLDAKTGAEFAKAFQDISGKAGDVKNINDGVKGDAQTLHTRLSILEVLLTKPPATEQIQTIVESQVKAIGDEVDRLSSEAKLDKTKILMENLNDPNSDKFNQLKSNPDFVKVEVASNNIRLANIPKHRLLVANLVAGLKQAIPESMRGNEKLAELLGQLDKFAETHETNMNDAETRLNECNKLIEEKLPQEAR